MLTRADLLAFRPKIEAVTVPEWNGPAYLRAYNNLERVQMLDAMAEANRGAEDYEEDQELPEDDRQGLPKVERLDEAIMTLIYSLCDEHGTLLLIPADYDVVKTWPHSVTVALWVVARRLNACTMFEPFDKKKEPSN